MTETTTPPRRYLSRDEQTVVVRLIQKMIALGRYASDIKTAIATRYNLSRRSATRYLHRARREMQEFVERKDDEHRTDSFYFYRSIIEDPESSRHERLRACERIDKLLGIELTVKYTQSRNFNKSIEEIENMTDEELNDYYNKLKKKYS